MQINVLDYLEKSATAYPEKVALIDEVRSLTFSQFQNQAKAIGSEIARKSLKTVRKPIMVFVDRTVETVCCYLGVVYSGNYYVPVDIQMPKQRIQVMLQSLSPCALVCARKDIALLEGIEGLPQVFLYEEAAETKIEEALLAEIRDQMIDTDPLYAIFTSGSTGVPKGIVVPHKNVIDLAEWLTDTFAFSNTEVLGNQTPFYFDASVKDIYTCLKNAATLCIIPKQRFMFPVKLVDYLNENKVTAILWATSAIVLVANSKVFEKKIPQYLTKVFFAGEAMWAKQLNVWRKHLPNLMYVNLYGPTETTVDCTYYIVNRKFSDEEQIPIGRACRNMQVMLLDENRKPVEQDEPGELCVRGTGVALGYVNDEKRSAEVFIQNPLNRSYRDIVYCTGDIARYNEYGELVFASRKDGQIKHMGNRIELGEIEAAINGLPGIQSGICFYDAEAEKIVLEYVGEAEKRDIITGVGEKLPKYMFPNIIVKQEGFPYNANGKIDRKKLKELYFNGKN